jgi:hypothetical protein
MLIVMQFPHPLLLLSPLLFKLSLVVEIMFPGESWRLRSASEHGKGR